jgi:tRNA(Ile)-lysidine synthase
MPTLKISRPEQQVLSYIREKNLVSRGEKLVVAVSGGPDSVCLLYILSGLEQELGIELHIAHLNHQLRGAASDADARYVAGLSRRLKIPATIGSSNVWTYRVKHRLTLEEAAREVRYNFLTEVAAEIGAEKAAVGHTADDHVETVLMHLLRGSGTRGLRGLLPISRWTFSGRSLTVIRPLMELNRQETVDYCRNRHLQPRMDASNLSLEPLRNRVRHHLLPELRKYNPQITEAILRLARTTADDMDFIEMESRRIQDKIVRLEKGSIIIDKKVLLALPPALQRQILRSSIEALRGNLKDIEATHIEDIVRALDKPSGKVIGLPFGLSFTIEYDRYVLAPEATSLCPFPTLESEIELKVPGNTDFSGWHVEASVIPPSAVEAMDRDKEADGFSACFDLARAGNHLTVRHRLPGDRFQPLGMAQPKKLNVFMIDARIPQLWRGHVPIVSADSQILWVVGWRIDERVKVRPDTRKVLRLEFKRV